MSARRFRKKPVVIEAMQYCDCEPGPIVEWSGARFIVVNTGRRDPDNPDESVYERVLAIQTLEGDMVIAPGDWVIRGVKGEFYPCNPDIFDATYDAVTR